MSSIWGNNLKISLFGQSHQRQMGITIDGFLCGMKLDFDYIDAFIARRTPNPLFNATSRAEKDNYEIISGVSDGFTNGSPITVIFQNKAYSNDDCTVARPSHADYTAFVKYKGFADICGGGHLSGRLTAPLTFAGALCAQALYEKHKIRIISHVKSILDICDRSFANYDNPLSLYERLFTSYPFIDDIADRVQALTNRLSAEKDSCGGVVECCVVGLPVGVGSPRFDGLDARLGGFLFSLPAVKGVEFGRGFDFANMTGKAAVDEFVVRDGKVSLSSNNCGGVNGGISNGMPLLFNVCFKPTPTIAAPVRGLNLADMTTAVIERKSPSDVCIALRACPIVEAAAAIVLLDEIA
ncbi:MAG: chorismate synthase [Clostridia bacterium]|nr:chorismate synthase [Clostridia bacterium]